MTVSVSSGCSLFHHYHCCEAISGVPCGIKTVSSLKEFQAWNFLADIFLVVFEKSRIKEEFEMFVSVSSGCSLFHHYHCCLWCAMQFK